MSGQLCELWQRFLSNPDNQRLRALARQSRDELAEHLEECGTCAAAEMPENPDLLASVYDALAGEDTPEESDDLFQLRSSIDAEVREAVLCLLYPALPALLVGEVHDIDALDVFRGIDAVAMTIDRFWRRRADTDSPVILSAVGLGGPSPEEPPAVSREQLVREIQIMTKQDTHTSSRLFHWTSLSARFRPMLFPGVITRPFHSHGLEVVSVERPIELDLARIWSPEAHRHHAFERSREI